MVIRSEGSLCSYIGHLVRGGVCGVDTQSVVLGRRPHCQPAVDGHNDQVLEELRSDHHKDHETAARGQVAPAHLGGRRRSNLVNGLGDSGARGGEGRSGGQVQTFHGILAPRLVVVDMLSSSSSSSSSSEKEKNH